MSTQVPPGDDRATALSLHDRSVMNETSTTTTQQTEHPMRAELSKTVKDAAAALRKPKIGATVTGVAVLAAGAMWGVTEALVAGAAAYAVFRKLKKNERRGD